MNSISFPKMFKGNSTQILKGSDATLNCIYLLLNSEVNELFGDPEFGIRIKRYTFEQNNYILRDIIIDEIYTQLTTFCPQIFLERKDIKIIQNGSKLEASITCKDQETFETNVYNLNLYKIEGEQE